MGRVMRILGVWLLLLALWEGAYRVFDWKPWVFPAPSHVIDASLGMLNVRTYLGDPLHAGWPTSPHPEGGIIAAPDAIAAPAQRSLWGSPLLIALPTSGVRLLAGFVVSLVLGTFLGVVMWRFEFVNSVVGPVFLGLQTLPSVCWVPLAILLLGINEASILFVLVMGSCFAMAISMRDGLRTVPPIYIAAGVMLGARKLRLYRHVLLPSSLPALAGTLRQGFGFAWRSLMGAELILIVQRRGLGFLLNAGRDFADIAQVVAVMMVMVGAGMAIDRWVFAPLEKRVRVRFGLVGRG